MRAEARSGSVSAAQATVATIPAHGEDLVEYSKIRSLGDCPVAKTLWASIQAGKVKTPSGEPNGAGADVSVAGVRALMEREAAASLRVPSIQNV